MVDHRKQAVSIRLGQGDIRNIKRIAKRLGVRDSDIIRFAIKSLLNRIAPLCDPGIRGRNLVPVLVESGDELIRHFELDSFRLDSIINENVEPGRRVERDDIALLAMSGLREEYLAMRLKEGDRTPAEPVDPYDGSRQDQSLRGYLYDKYVYRNSDYRRSGVNGPDGINGHNGHNGHNGVNGVNGQSRAEGRVDRVESSESVVSLVEPAFGSRLAQPL